MQRRLRPFFSLILLLASLVPASTAAETPLASKKLLQALADEVSGEIAWRYTDLISHFDRVQASEEAVSAEFGPVDMQSIYGFFEALEKAGLMTLRQAR